MQNLRTAIFLLIDLIKGGKFQEEYQNLERYLKTVDYEILKEFQIFKLKRLLQNVQDRCVFYSEYTNFNKFDELPVINKNVINDNLDTFLSLDYKQGKIKGKAVTTSGSTGSPFSVIHDRGKLLAHTAELIFFNELAGYNFGDKLYYFRVWDRLVSKSRLKAFMQNIVLMDSSSLDCGSLQKYALKKLDKEMNGASVLAYASTLEALSNCLPAGNFQGRLNSILSMSETLPEGSRKKLEDYFKCRVVSRYSNMENGMIALQIPECSYKYLVNEVGFIVEILKLDTDERLDIGETGRIVITDLNSYAQPLIRYDTGDVGSLCYDEFNGVKRLFLKNIEGRKVDFITDTKGDLVSPHVITNSMWKHKMVRQFQFIQIDTSEYKLILNVDEQSNEVINPIVDDIRYYVGEDARIAIEFTEDIPILKSGKRKKVMNLKMI